MKRNLKRLAIFIIPFVTILIMALSIYQKTEIEKELALSQKENETLHQEVDNIIVEKDSCEESSILKSNRIEELETEVKKLKEDLAKK